MKKTPLTLTFISLIAISCTNKNDCTGGAGGNLTIVVFPQHHGTPILNHPDYRDTVYLKFNTQANPGANVAAYDTKFIGAAGEDHVHCTGLQCGDYYIFAVGYDSTRLERVSGGIPYTTAQKSGEVDVILPVTE